MTEPGRAHVVIDVYLLCLAHCSSSWTLLHGMWSCCCIVFSSLSQQLNSLLRVRTLSCVLCSPVVVLCLAHCLRSWTLSCVSCGPVRCPWSVLTRCYMPSGIAYPSLRVTRSRMPTSSSGTLLLYYQTWAPPLQGWTYPPEVLRLSSVNCDVFFYVYVEGGVYKRDYWIIYVSLFTYYL